MTLLRPQVKHIGSMKFRILFRFFGKEEYPACGNYPMKLTGLNTSVEGLMPERDQVIGDIVPIGYAFPEDSKV